MVASPPASQIAPTDHAALVAWYDKEATQLRQKAKDMEMMTQRYLKEPQLAHIEGGLPPKADLFSTAAPLAASIRRELKKPTRYPGSIGA